MQRHASSASTIVKTNEWTKSTEIIECFYFETESVPHIFII